MPSGQETRIVDPMTGAVKGSKLARMSLIPWSIVVELGEHFGRGARKYAERNWEAGYAWSLSFDALHRHLEAFWRGEDLDPDPGLIDPDGVARSRHIIAVMWHACVLAFYSRYGVGTDDRPIVPTERDALDYVQPVAHVAQAPIRFAGVELLAVPDVAGRDLAGPYG